MRMAILQSSLSSERWGRGNPASRTPCLCNDEAKLLGRSAASSFHGSAAVETAVPLHEPAYSYLDRCGGGVSGVALERPDVGVGVGHVPGLQRQHPQLGLAPQAVL